jgi:multiple sugar transport system permease protein
MTTMSSLAVPAAATPVSKTLSASRDPEAVGRRSLWNILFITPFMLVFATLVLVPVGLGAWLSFQDYDMLSGYHGPVGWKNYFELWNDRIFIRSVWNTTWFVCLTTPAFVAVGLFLALALNNSWRSSAILRSVFFGSSILSVTIVTLIWRLVYMQDRGLIANLLTPLGIPAPAFITSETLALPGIAIVTVWWIIGLPMMLFLAALQQIPRELYEAAALDNASRWRTLVSVTLPAIKRTVILVAVLEVVLQFQLFGQAHLITGGGPNNASRPIVMFIYEAGFRDWALGYAAAASQVLFVLMMGAALLQMWLGRTKAEG